MLLKERHWHLVSWSARGHWDLEWRWVTGNFVPKKSEINLMTELYANSCVEICFFILLSLENVSFCQLPLEGVLYSLDWLTAVGDLSSSLSFVLWGSRLSFVVFDSFLPLDCIESMMKQEVWSCLLFESISRHFSNKEWHEENDMKECLFLPSWHEMEKELTNKQENHRKKLFV